MLFGKNSKNNSSDILKIGYIFPETPLLCMLPVTIEILKKYDFQLERLIGQSVILKGIRGKQ